MLKLHYEILPKKQKELWTKLSKHYVSLDDWGFYLAGGTALALQLGHRQSVDFDFFSQKMGVRTTLHQWLEQFPNYLLREGDEHTIHAELDGVKISFIGGYRYPLVEPCSEEGQRIKLASILDIAVMKLLAISHRAALRDYLDLALIIRDHFSLEKLLEASGKKYGKNFNKMIPLRALVSFQDLDQEWPVLLDKKLAKSWQSILQKAVKEIVV